MFHCINRSLHLPVSIVALCDSARCPSKDWALEQHIERISNRLRLAIRVRHLELGDPETWDLSSANGDVAIVLPRKAEDRAEVELVQYPHTMAGLHLDL